MQREVNMKQIIDEYADMVYRIALTRCRCIENAEDVFQDVFMKLSIKNPKFEIYKKPLNFWGITSEETANNRVSQYDRRQIDLQTEYIYKVNRNVMVISYICQTE